MVIRKRTRTQCGEDVNYINVRWFRLSWIQPPPLQWQASNQTIEEESPICGEPLFNGEEIETHHIVPVAKGGRNDIENLVHLHRACHKQEHSKSKLNA